MKDTKEQLIRKKEMLKVQKIQKSTKLREKGITLIALVVTIVILLILTGVTLNMTLSDNGLFKKAKESVEKYEKATVEEQRQLVMSEATMNFKNTEYTDENGEKVIIPAGFAVSHVEGENTIDDGLVIIDGYGNEFVWIPSGTYDENTKTYSTKEYEDAAKYTNAKNEGGKEWRQTDYKINSSKSGWSNPEKQMDNAKTSIKKYGGFYVARYEAGVPEGVDFYVASDEGSDGKIYENETKKNISSDLKPVSKKGNQVWTFISQKNAEIVSKNMYNTSNSVTSYLIDSNAWNYICEDIFKGKCGKNIESDSTEYGNYYNNEKTNYEDLNGLYAIFKNPSTGWELATEYKYGKIPLGIAPKNDPNNINRLEIASGICDDFKVYNIYDMAGNMWEMTAETCNSNNRIYCAIRGGALGDKGNDHTVTVTFGNSDIEKTDCNFGFRVVLYLT